jgi:hypothetical protein
MEDEEIDNCLNIWNVLENEKLTRKGLLNFMELLLQGEYHVDGETGAIFECEYNQTYDECSSKLDNFIDTMNKMESETKTADILVSKLKEESK